MSDDWSLKNRKKSLSDCMRPVSLNDEHHCDCFFKEEDIEILREKLIEDIKKLEYQYSHSLAETNGIEGYLSGFDEAKDYIKIIINKRFGKEGD